MRRAGRVAGWLFGAPFVILPASLGIVAVLLWTAPGRRLTARAVTEWISSKIAGRIEIGRMGGNVLRHLVLEDVRLADSVGGEIVRARRIDVRYLLPELLAGRYIFREVTLDQPVVHLARLRAGGWNYERVFRSRKGNGGQPPRVELHDLTLHGGTVRVDEPTTPRPPGKPVSRHGAEPPRTPIAAGSDGPVRVYDFDSVEAVVPLLRLSTPDHLPILARISQLRTDINDPAVHLRSFRGTLLTAGDSLRFTLDSGSMPGTSLRGAGLVRWPQDTLRYDFTLDADRVDLVDLRWISPDFPAWQGSGRVIAHSPSSTRTEFRLEHLVLGDGRARAAGTLVAITDAFRGVGVRDLSLALQRTPLEVMRPFLDTLPFAGTLTGRLTADGFLDTLRLGGDLIFTDAMVPGAPTSHIVMDGRVHFGTKDGAVFEDFRLQNSAFALATVHRVSPSVVLPGTMALDGHLDGPWQDARFRGTAEHLAPNGARSRLVGLAQLDIRDSILGVNLDADFDQLSFDALRTGYPELTASGGLVGHVVASGTLAALAIQAHLTGDMGTIDGGGRITALAPRFGADSLDLQLQRFNLAALLSNGQSTALNGRVVMSGTIDSGVPPSGRFDLSLDRSRVGGVNFANATARLAATRGILTVDTATVHWADGFVAAHGTLGWSAPDSGTLVVHAEATSLGSLDSLVRATLGLAPDTLHPQRFDGHATAEITVSGARDAANLAGTIDADSVVLDRWHVDRLHAQVVADSFGARGLRIDAQLDSLGHGDDAASRVALAVAGRRDSMEITASGRMRDLQAGVRGRYLTSDSVQRIGIDAATFDFPRQAWRLARPTAFTIRDAGVALADTLFLVTSDGSGAITLVGTLPGDSPGSFGASVVGLSLGDVYGLMQQDSAALGGIATLDLHLGGTRELPTLRGSASITGPVAGDVRAPLVRAVFDYGDHRLRSNVTFWSSGDPILGVDVSLPYDLALVSRENRRLPGPLSITAQADSIDLLVLEALLPSVRNARGSLSLDLAASGTWAEPVLRGRLGMREGAMTVPGLGVHWEPINGSARFIGDSMVIDSLDIRSGEGDLSVTGGVRFANLKNVTLNLALRARDFLAINQANFLEMRPTGNVTLTGPIAQPVLRPIDGSPVTVSRSVLYFADLITKNVLDPTDPLLQDLVDTATYRRQGLGAEFQNRFLDSLRIENLTFRVGDEVWLRSNEANVQLEGQVQVNKLRKRYQLAGTLTAPRGTYTLRIGDVLPRDFTIQSGTVKYGAYPDLNAEISLQAQHVVHSSDGEEIPIVARIDGTMAVPRLTLTSPGRNLTLNEIVSYLTVGRPDLQLPGGQSALVGQVSQETLSLLFGEVRQSLAALYGFDLQVRPGVSTQGTGLTQLALGKQINSRFFASLNAGFCIGATGATFSGRNFGASLDYRISREWHLQANAEPVQSCLSNSAVDVFTTLTRYQLGANLIWTREY